MILWLLASLIVGGTCARNTYHSRNTYANRYRPSPDRRNYFDAELLEVFAREKEGNVVISPLSIKLALGMIMMGASGKSADEIQTSLRLSREDGGQFFQEILSSVKGSSTNDLQIASQIFVPLESRVNRSYQKSLMEVFQSGVTPLSFQNPVTAHNVLNKWVAEATYGLIPKISERDQIDPNTKLIVANAVYFKGKWQKPFLRGKTTQKCFYTYKDQCMNVNMMSESGQFDFGYIPKLDAYAVNLPYEGKRFSMLLILPEKKYGHKQLSLDLLHVNLDEVISQLQPQEVYVEIPRFTIKTDTNLIPTLTQLRINDIFSSRADLSNIFDSPSGPVAVSRVFHSAKIIVDEEGVESAAVSGSSFVPLMGGSITSFRADHPFLFFIRDVITGTVLFSGKMEIPEREEARATESEKSTLNVANNGYSIQSQADGDLGDFSVSAQDFPQPIGRRTPSARPQAAFQGSFSRASSVNQGRYSGNRTNNERQKTEPQFTKPILRTVNRGYSVQSQTESGLRGFSGNAQNIPQSTSGISYTGQQTVSQGSSSGASSLNQGRYSGNRTNNERQKTEPQSFTKSPPRTVNRSYSTQPQTESGLRGFSGNDENIPLTTSGISYAGQQTVPQGSSPGASSSHQERYPDNRNNNERLYTDPVSFLQRYPQQTFSTTNYNPYFPNRMFFGV